MSISRVEVSLIELLAFTTTPKSTYHVDVSCGGIDVSSSALQDHQPLMWNEDFNFNFVTKKGSTDGLGGTLRVSLHQTVTKTNKSTFLGEVSMRLESLTPNIAVDQKLQLRSRGGTGTETATVRIICTYITNVDETQSAVTGGSPAGTPPSRTSIAYSLDEDSAREEISMLREECDRLRERITELESREENYVDHCGGDVKISFLESKVAQLSLELDEAKKRASAAAEREAELIRNAATAQGGAQSRSAVMSAIRSAEGVPTAEATEDEKKLRVLKTAYKKLRAENATLLEENASLKSQMKSLTATERKPMSIESGDSSLIQALKQDRQLLQEQLVEKENEIAEGIKKHGAERQKVLAKLVEKKEEIDAVTRERDQLRAQLAERDAKK